MRIPSAYDQTCGKKRILEAAFHVVKEYKEVPCRHGRYCKGFVLATLIDAKASP